MSEDQDKPVAAGAIEPRGGERLAYARRERQISALEIAKELHLDESKVRALENNDFDALGAPVFAKGYLRKYAQLVGVMEADVLADYYAMTRAAELPPVVVGRGKKQKELSPGPWIAALAILAVAAGAYWWFAASDNPAATVQPPPVDPDPAATEPVPTEPARADTEAPAESVPEANESLPSLPDPEQQQAVDAPPVAADEAAVADEQLSVAMLFSGECWTEISDADGRRLFLNMGRAGQSVSVRGKAPISALFGNVANVSVQVDGNEYALPVARNTNGTVRVTIAKP
ncbi:MAG: DUF4115 domain-containing protein [Gammaproteobacteria bacterium]|nr:DUF4115 domain-containing protein [Gammaproteobacteria bacterium]MDH5305434.1 DUF4115 domain-containing protein [Gammaproteobacteria bacterium]MDH5323647.1 DUF4115 domain-containing protein [Gammaproteobacteria bacterium]